MIVTEDLGKLIKAMIHRVKTFLIHHQVPINNHQTLIYSIRLQLNTIPLRTASRRNGQYGRYNLRATQDQIGSTIGEEFGSVRAQGSLGRDLVTVGEASGRETACDRLAKSLHKTTPRPDPDRPSSSPLSAIRFRL
ncbi:hypothetical protein F2Q70_00017367 [Brassica cretica]|uniref:Uncharacterized protein n=1 Tax=Brassica cretica TaxID=69181 RepID=A0A8S9I0I6_BRACR|nr:hypothetical protein F2Q70_00017367 [Brassica cretica]